MTYDKKSLITNKYANIPAEICIGGRTYRKYVSALLLDELLDKLESFNPKDFVEFLPYIVFLQLGMNYSVAVGLSQLTIDNEKLNEIRLWLIEQCNQIHADSLTETIVEQPNIIVFSNISENENNETSVIEDPHEQVDDVQE